MFKYYKMMFKKSFDFKGRATRAEFWYVYFTNLIILFLIVLLPSEIMKAIGSENIDLANIIAATILYIYIFVTIIPLISLSVRRLHDINMSGWWYLWIFIIPIGHIFLLQLFAMDSKDYNKYGPNPKKLNDS